MPTFDFMPTDTLFCRDQRPLAAGSSFGRGANWPLPTVLHSAIRTALLWQLPTGLPQRKSQPGHRRRGEARGWMATDAFQWLNIRGPFPVDKSGNIYFPIPRDLVPDGDSKATHLRIICNCGSNNLPQPLAHLAASFARPSKDRLADWVSLEFYNDYLRGAGALDRPAEENLWDSEHRIGVAIKPDTQTAAEGQLYAAEHLRLRDGVKLRFAVSEDPHKRERALIANRILQLGGEQRFGRVTTAEGELTLPRVEVAGTLVKWVLLTPAIFAHGWRPGWIDESGNVKLRVVDKEQRRDLRRRRCEAGWKYEPALDDAPTILARLVAACVGKLQVVGGWDSEPKPTYLAVPSGSVYYFRSDNEDEAERLCKVLQGRCRSDFFGEKGLGLGVCGTWSHQDQTRGNVPAAPSNPKTS